MLPACRSLSGFRDPAGLPSFLYLKMRTITII
nr:MAG TPA: hypothetical protein [Caudoviricetes sp.]